MAAKHPVKFPSRMVIDPRPLPVPVLVQVPFFLSREECNIVSELYADKDMEYGMIGNGHDESYSLKPSARLARTAVVTEDQAGWLYKCVKHEVERLNKEIFQYEIYGALDDIVLARYTAENGRMGHGRFGWHSDAAEGTSVYRKFSIVVSLSDPDDYEGGEFKVFNCGERSYRPRKGELFAFPSYMQHMVAPVTKGVRDTLVIFVQGPRFR